MNERFRNFFDFLCKERIVFNKSDFARIMGWKSSSMVTPLYDGAQIGDKLAQNIAAKFPQLNWKYLTDPDCTEMLRPVDASTTGDFSRNVSSSINVSQNADLVAVIQKQQEQIDRLLAIIEKLTK